MATASVTYTFAAAAQIKSAEFNTNFADLTTFLNSNVVHKDGAVAMTGRLTLASLDPTSADHAVRKSYLEKVVGPVVKLRRVANQSIANDGLYHSISWDTEDLDAEGWIAVTSSTLTCQTAGTYTVTALGTFDIFAAIPIKDKLIVGGRSASGYFEDFPTGLSLTVPLTVGQTIQYQVLHNGGVNSNWTGALYVTRVGLG